MKSKIIIGIVAAVAVLGGGYTVSRMDFIGTGKVGIVYNYKDGVQDTVLTPGMHFIAPMNKVKEFSTSISYNVLAVTVQRATAPGFPVKIKVTSKTKMRFIGVMRAYNENGYKAISFKIVDSL